MCFYHNFNAMIYINKNIVNYWKSLFPTHLSYGLRLDKKIVLTIDIFIFYLKNEQYIKHELSY